MSAATVIATIESAKIAQQLIDELIEAGFKDQDVEILAGDEDELVAEIVERGFGKDDARDYAEAVSRGKTWSPPVLRRGQGREGRRHHGAL